jgi:hypothetical protein
MMSAQTVVRRVFGKKTFELLCTNQNFSGIRFRLEGGVKRYIIGSCATAQHSSGGHTSPTSTPSQSPPISGCPLRKARGGEDNRYLYRACDNQRVILQGDNTWGNLQDGFTNGPWLYNWGNPYDWSAAIRRAVANNNNYIRLWTYETDQVRYDLNNPGATPCHPSIPNCWQNVDRPTPLPWSRTASGLYDLYSFNPDYFNRLRSRTQQAQANGIYVSVMLFENWSARQGIGGYLAWDGSPFKGGRNINGISAGPQEVHRLSISSPGSPVRRAQEAYIRKVVDTLNDLDNVIYEICNECPDPGWQNQIVDFLREYLSTKRWQPIYASAVHPEISTADVCRSNADIIAPGEGDGIDYFNNPRHPCPGKVVIVDTDHVGWDAFEHGANPTNFVCENLAVGNHLSVLAPYPGGVYDQIRHIMGNAHRYCNLPFLSQTQPTLASPTQQATQPPTQHNSQSSHSIREDESMAMMAWGPQGKNKPDPRYDKCEDGTDVVLAHNMYYVVAYDGKKYPTWHPPVVVNPVTGVGKCFFGHEHGTNPQGYQYWQQIVEHFGKDLNGDGRISPLVIAADGRITSVGDRAGIPFGIANEMMEGYYNKEGRDSIFVRHEDHVGHKIEFVNGEADMQGNSTHVMGNNTRDGIHVPYGKSNQLRPTGVMCTHLHKFHQGTHSSDAYRNNLHEVIFHSTCKSTHPAYKDNTVLLTGMMAFGEPGEYRRFCSIAGANFGDDRFTRVCMDGERDGKCVLNDPLIARLPNSIHSNTLGRNMVDRVCLERLRAQPRGIYFTPYEIWQGDLRISRPDGSMIAEHGRQWDVLDPIRYVDPSKPAETGYNWDECFAGGALAGRTLACGPENIAYDQSVNWSSPKAGFKGLRRTTYFGVNHLRNAGGSEIYWTDPLGGNAVERPFQYGLKQFVSRVDSYIIDVQSAICRAMNDPGSESCFLNDRAIQRRFDDGNGTVHAPN